MIEIYFFSDIWRWSAKYTKTSLFNNAHLQSANLTKNAIQDLGWEVLPHSPYSSDLAPSDYHLSQLIPNFLRGVSFNNDVELKMWLDEFLKSGLGDFHSQNIDKLVEYWLEVVNNEGEYITDRFVKIVNRMKINGKTII